MRVIPEALKPQLLTPEESISAESNIPFSLHEREMWPTGILKYQYFLPSRHSSLACNKKDSYSLLLVEVAIHKAQTGGQNTSRPVLDWHTEIPLYFPSELGEQGLVYF